MSVWRQKKVSATSETSASVHVHETVTRKVWFSASEKKRVLGTKNKRLKKFRQKLKIAAHIDDRVSDSRVTVVELIGSADKVESAVRLLNESIAECDATVAPPIALSTAAVEVKEKTPIVEDMKEASHGDVREHTPVIQLSDDLVMDAVSDPSVDAFRESVETVEIVTAVKNVPLVEETAEKSLANEVAEIAEETVVQVEEGEYVAMSQGTEERRDEKEEEEAEERVEIEAVVVEAETGECTPVATDTAVVSEWQPEGVTTVDGFNSTKTPSSMCASDVSSPAVVKCYGSRAETSIGAEEVIETPTLTAISTPYGERNKGDEEEDDFELSAKVVIGAIAIAATIGLGIFYISKYLSNSGSQKNANDNAANGKKPHRDSSKQ